MQKKNDISNRVYCLSPAVESGRDRECTNKDFYKKCYRLLAKNIHPDNSDGNIELCSV